MIACNLAAETNARNTACFEDRFFCGSNLRRLTVKELDTAGGAASFSATSVELVGTSFFAECRDQPFALWDVEGADSVNC